MPQPPENEEFMLYRLAVQMAKKRRDEALLYHAQVDSEMHQMAEANVDIFVRQLMRTVQDNVGDLREHLNPTTEQMDLVLYLSQGRARPYITDGIVKEGYVNPFIARTYKAGDVLEDHTMNVFWDVRRNMPMMIGIHGEVHKVYIKSLMFLISEQQIRTPQDVQSAFNRSPNPTTSYTFSEDGRSFTIKSVERDQEGTHTGISPYHLIGNYTLPLLQSPIWLYGHKDQDYVYRKTPRRSTSSSPAGSNVIPFKRK